MLTHQIRRHFLDYFHHQNHTVIPSAPLIPHNDPSLLFVNAGMVPFKNIFTGLEKPLTSRAVSAQKCVRAGGKHNDLENVGYTARHHTFFEMLGNFSFGDYFKEEAILYAWTFVTRELGISPDHLCVTVYAEDQETAHLWKKIAHLPDAKIISIASSDNFWSMGEVGPCGPCTEIFYDHGESVPGGPPGSAEADGDRFVEIWNLVFMQYEQLASGERVLLPKPSIDTGMGLERIAAVLQGVHDNYETDIFRALITQATHLTQTSLSPENKASFKVIADHVRAGAFLVADGILPSNEGRGYVLRRILRRAMRHAYFLGARDPLLVRLLPTLIQEMGEAYPELGRAQAFTETTFDLEERRFQQTLEKGLSLLAQETTLLAEEESLSGAVAFKLYDTFGFPLDLTQDILREQGRTVDEEGFQKLMAEQKALARAAWVGSGEQGVETIFLDLAAQIGETTFLGYTHDETSSRVQALFVEGKAIPSLNTGQTGLLIVNQTPFYAESGGQVGDTGFLNGSDNSQGRILDTQKKAGLFLHTLEMTQGSLHVGQEVLLGIDRVRRNALRQHHSATHLLHQALRDILGDHVTQRGSYVTPEKLRFDFSHTKRLTLEELKALERGINQVIRSNDPVTTRLMTPESAVQAGALALFGERYGEEVRVVSIGPSSAASFSTELCGGTHVTRTGDMGFFKIISENGIAAGIRRIEAVVGESAEQYVDNLFQTARDTADLLKIPVSQLPEKVERLLAEKQARGQNLKTTIPQPLFPVQRETLEPGITFVFQETQNLTPQAMKGLMDQLKQEIGRGFIVLGQNEEGRTSFLLGSIGEPLDLRPLLQTLLTPWGGRGGGRSDLVQAGWIGDPTPQAAAQDFLKLLRQNFSSSASAC